MEVKVVAREIGEDGQVEPHAIHTPQLQGVAGDLHGHVRDTALTHDSQQRVDVRGLRGGSHGGHDLIADLGGHGADEPRGAPSGPKRSVDEVARRRLAVRPGDPRHGQRCGRFTVDPGRDRAQHGTRVVDDQHWKHASGVATHDLGPGWIGEDRDGPRRLRHRSEPGAMGVRARQCRVEVSREHPAGVQGHAGHLVRWPVGQPQHAAQGGTARAGARGSDHCSYQVVGITGDLVPDGGIFNSCNE